MRREDAPERICVWDVESTGIDIETDRILTAYAMIQRIDGKILSERHWTINPGVPVPTGASDVHGMTTEWIKENGRTDVSVAIAEIAEYLYSAALSGAPIVGYNNSYDLGILDRELRRNIWKPLHEQLPDTAQFFDPIIFDRATDKYRKGGRKLIDVARHYGLEIDESRLHEAEYDVILTARLSWKLLQKSAWTLAELQSRLGSWKKDWAEHLTEYFASQGKTEEDGRPIIVDGSFPWKRREE